jgi:hypothetical protein
MIGHSSQVIVPPQLSANVFCGPVTQVRPGAAKSAHVRGTQQLLPTQT